MLVLACCCWGGSLRAEAKDDYLTAAEIEQLREAQEPHLRLKVLGELLENRLDKARAIKDPASVKAKPPEPKPEKKKKPSPTNRLLLLRGRRKPEPTEIEIVSCLDGGVSSVS